MNLPEDITAGWTAEKQKLSEEILWFRHVRQETGSSEQSVKIDMSINRWKQRSGEQYRCKRERNCDAEIQSFQTIPGSLLQVCDIATDHNILIHADISFHSFSDVQRNFMQRRDPFAWALWWEEGAPTDTVEVLLSALRSGSSLLEGLKLTI
jgi:hypothetical protein